MSKQPLTPETMIKRNEELAYSAIDGEVVMMSVDQGKYYGLNPMGSHIWNLLEQPKTVAELCLSLREGFDVTEAQCFEEVSRFLERVSENKLVALTP